MHEKDYILGINLINGVGPGRFAKIIKHFTSAEAFWKSNDKEIIELFGQNTGTKIAYQRYEIDINEAVGKLQKMEIKFATILCSEYPFLLSQITDPPICIFYKGILEDQFNKAITIVGTRKPTSYGTQIIREIIPSLVKNGFTTLSGLAFGIDKYVHQVTLENNGKTLAVIASPPNIPTPLEHTKLAENILKNNGLIISEYFPGTEIRPENFPKRNRILAGLSKSTLIVEASERSGALITGNLAFDYNRLVFAFPGNINQKMSIGCNNLIKNQKAKLVGNMDDIFVELGINNQSKLQKKLPNKEIEKLILSILSAKSLTLDELTHKINVSLSELISIITEMEINQYIYKNHFGEYVSLI